MKLAIGTFALDARRACKAAESVFFLEKVCDVFAVFVNMSEVSTCAVANIGRWTNFFATRFVKTHHVKLYFPVMCQLCTLYCSTSAQD